MAKSKMNLMGMYLNDVEIDQLEQSIGGDLVTDVRLSAFLERIMHRVIREQGKVPKELKIRDRPFCLYIPVQVVGRILNMPGIDGLKTNRYLFIEVRRYV